MNFLNQKILITGVCGTVGSELLRQIALNGEPLRILGIDNNESNLFDLQQEFKDHNNIDFSIADVRDSKTCRDISVGVDIIFHVAALKHVNLCESSPLEAVSTNITGVQNIIDAGIYNGVEKVVFTSSDKAVNPSSVMGTTKLMGERLITSANLQQSLNKGPQFISTRFGNVLGSRGSVIPIFVNQIKNGGPVTLTDESMTRFIMSIEQAAQLIIHSSQIARGGEVFITKMPVVSIKDIAEVLIHELAEKYGYDQADIEISNIGVKPGEKIFEELMSEEEIRRSIELENYFVVKPAFSDMYTNIDYDYENIISGEVNEHYRSSTQEKLSQAEIKEFLFANKII